MEELLSTVLIIFSTSLLLFILARAFYTLVWMPKKFDKELKRAGFKGSPYKFLIGDFKEIGRSLKESWARPMDMNHQIVPRAIPFVHNAVQKHGKTSVLWIGAQPRVIISDVQLLKEVFSNKDGCFQQIQVTNPLLKLLAMGLSVLDGEQWMRHRKIIVPAFYMLKLKGMIPTFSISCHELIRRWEEFTSPQGSFELDVWPEIKNLTGDAISRAAFSSSYEEGKIIFQLQKEQIALMNEAAYSMYVPGFRFIPTKKNKRRMYLNKKMKAILTDLIHRKEEGMKKGELSSDDLLGLLLQSYREGDSTKSSALTIDEIIEECKLFYIAGAETTSSLITWTLILLAMHPRWQEEAREEVVRICGKNPADYECISRLKIVTMILYEVLRLYPPVPVVHRHTGVQTKVGDLSIPAGVEIILPIILIHHDPLIWGRDAQEFNPNRFSEGISKTFMELFFPFGTGPRMCPGMNFAMIQAKMVIAMILQKFSFELSPHYIHAPIAFLITLQPQHGANIILRRL
ncbi:cytochrome P450 CYP72A219-like protein [Cinnamomum micranthum f. kanehirae]|uniref:Cytochrome P450 CYP72A219-like protein n=1 Tax=Cinnamomum micranthum f. kanehirae TaxID=337451 RepID=A0A443PE13_9MAGN|nr:cytochrome P450 CYP72A219-like protein [Cinnamomum micranthum f. kanehirae]